MKFNLKEIYSIVCLTLLPFMAFTQPKIDVHDSINQHYTSIVEDTSKVNYLNDVSKSYWRTSNDTALKYAEDALKLSIEVEFSKGRCRALNYVGIVYTNMGDYEKSEQYLQKALDLAMQLKNEDQQLKILNSLGIAQRKQGNYPRAINYMLGALNLLEKTENVRSIGAVNMNIGNIYFSLKEFDSATNYYQRSNRLFESLNFKKGLELTYNNLGDVHAELGNLDTALHYFNKSLTYKLESKNLAGIAINYVNIGELYFKKDSLEGARDYFNKSMSYFNQTGVNTEIAHAYYGLGQVDLKGGHIKEGLINFEKAYDIARKSNLKLVLKNSCEMISRSYEYLNGKDLALKYYKEYVKLRYELINEDNYKEVTQLKHRFEMEKRERKIELLTTQNNLATLSLSKKKREQFFTLLIAIMLLSFGLILFWAIWNRSKLKQQLLMTEIDQLRVQLKGIVEGNSDSIGLDKDRLNDTLGQSLSDREFEILNFAISDLSNTEIAEKTFVSVNTVKFHLKNIYAKLGVTNRKEALKFAIQTTSK